MRICLVSQEFPPDTARGGIGTQYALKARGLASRGHQVYVISRGNGNHGTTIDGSLIVIRIPGFESRLPEMTDPVQWLTQSAGVAAELDRLHREVGLDIVDFPEWGAEGYIWLLNRTEWHTVPTVIHLQGPLVMLAHAINYPEPGSAFYDVGSHMEGTCLRLADRVFSSSECSARWVREYYRIEQNEIPVFHLGIEAEIFGQRNVAKAEHPTIIFVGKLVENKGVEELVEAAARLAGTIPGLRLRLVGSGTERYVKHLRAVARSFDAEEMLEFAGFLPRTELAEEYNRAHVFAAPSHYEGGPGYVYLEAMACGLPVVGCSGSGVDEVITDGINGFLVEPKNVDQLESALHRLLTDEHLRDRMSRGALEFVRQSCDLDASLDRLERLYRDVIEASRK
jgi:glycosyltransferase involved in cell wall biosynthesis